MGKRLRRSWIHWTERPGGGEESALLLVGSGLVRFNAVAAWVWRQVETSRDRRELFRRMRRRYRGVTDRRLRSDLDGLLDFWLSRGWIEGQENPVFPFPGEPWAG
jgi:hypothetical protein